MLSEEDLSVGHDDTETCSNIYISDVQNIRLDHAAQNDDRTTSSESRQI